ncbi:ShlB/FhaC/HecB family hemolysin secretion/activation protein [Rhodanobacter sp. A1T4]|uniref:ShlB/FhaC/HecB family hemolysin secretion/activation protein n=1 Tax=Rhodanobacter sp. A1T4 TaxID=2723087 RepID=UPI001617FD56|nr:ShlB/FhaC/HecB family hemolysin secretion/activation protein [Rhodanobacter sp. A1T4]MBB6248850.1 hemolysin activation/secretion protein [Rhodanobacter sp. A1T4]
MNKIAQIVVLMMLSISAQAQTRLPSANPLQVLPMTPPLPSHAKVSSSFSTHRNPALEALLGVKLTPRRIELADMHALPFRVVADDFHTLIGHEVTVADVLAKADRCTARYRKSGYALSFCYIPTQNFANGVVKVIAVEGYVARVQLTGDAGNMEHRLRGLAKHIQADRPLRQATFERYTQLMGQLPGVVVTANVPPPTTTDGAAELQLKVTRRRVAVTGGVDVNHPGVRGLINVTLNGLTPLGEQVTLSTLYPNGQGSEHYLAGSWTQPLGSRGWSWRLDGSNYRGNPDTDQELPAGLEHRVDQNRVGASLRDAVLLDNSQTLVASAGIYSARQSDHYLNLDNGAQLSSDSDLHVATLGLDWRASSAQTVRTVTVGIAHGFNAFGASANVSSNVPGAFPGELPDTAFTRFNVDATMSTQWPDHFGSVLSFSGQYSRDRLASGEQIAFGGPRYGLAYDPGILSGDYGWGAGYEINRRFGVTQHWLTSLTPYLLAQYARAFANGDTASEGHLGTVALGLRLSDGKHYNIDVSAAQPISSQLPGIRDNSVRFDLGFSYSFL